MKKFASFIPVVVFAAGVILAVVGANNGENETIKSKGVIVCTECIGIGDKLMPDFYEFRVTAL